ncbi:MAG: SH3 domain-containing protein [Chloroflexi bacterium]|nr:SH3 domain-containing protein [Chloroflexota bacterium]
MRRTAKLLTLIASLAGLLALAGLNSGLLLAAQLPQLPTETLQPTATFGGPTVFVSEQVNVRSGPGTNYDQVGVMVAGQTAPALGRSQAGEWIQIEYPGGPGNRAWVFALLVALRAGTVDALPVVGPPPTPTLPPTPTFELGTASASTATATRLPTFTPAPPVAQATFGTPDLGGGGFPPALLILGLFVIGVFAGVVAILRQRA